MDVSVRSDRLFEPRRFEPLELALDDRLEAELRLVLGYRHSIDPRFLERALNSGIDAFPHLTGRLDRGKAGQHQWSLLQSDRPLRMELVESRGPAADLWNMPHDELAERFLPVATDGAGGRPLFGLRWTRCGGMDVLGLRVSHAAVDGIGLGWFARCCAAATTPKVVHDRKVLAQPSGAAPTGVPPGYRDAGPLGHDWSWCHDPWTAHPAFVFSVPVDAMRRDAGDGSLLALRMRLAAMLGTALAEIAPGLHELALWCDPRGTGGLPANFTGNAGCYLHLPLQNESEDRLAAALLAVATRSGFQQVNRVFGQLRAAEATGRMVVWDGPREDVVQLNMLPRVFEAADLGGLPVFSQLLSRNSSGLRISVTPDGKSFVCEASLAQGWAEAMFAGLRIRRLEPRRLGGGCP